MSTEVKKSKGKGWPKVASIRRNDKGSYVKLEPGVEIYLNGEKLELSDQRVLRLEDPRAKVEQFKASGHITEAEADKRLEKLAEMTWLRFDVIAVPPRT